MRTTVNIELADYLNDVIDEIAGELEEAIENIRKYRPNKVTHSEEVDLDIHELLEEEHAIVLIWDTGMLLSHYPHLTEAQAWEVLQECWRQYNAEHGLTWDDIAEAVAELHPDPDDFLMPQRIAHFEKSLEGYTDSDEANLTDLLADAMHWSKRKGQCFERSLDTATMHFTCETKNE